MSKGCHLWLPLISFIHYFMSYMSNRKLMIRILLTCVSHPQPQAAIQGPSRHGILMYLSDLSKMAIMIVDQVDWTHPPLSPTHIHSHPVFKNAWNAFREDLLPDSLNNLQNAFGQNNDHSMSLSFVFCEWKCLVSSQKMSWPCVLL